MSTVRKHITVDVKEFDYYAKHNLTAFSTMMNALLKELNDKHRSAVSKTADSK